LAILKDSKKYPYVSEPRIITDNDMNRFYDYQTTPNQQERLEECERTITLAYFSLFDLTNRLKQIKCQKLYLPHYPTFDEYMEERWGIDQDTFVAYCKILTVVDDLLDAKIPVDLFSSIGKQQEAWRGVRLIEAEVLAG
jgi:hypothetical protein